MNFIEYKHRQTDLTSLNVVGQTVDSKPASLGSNCMQQLLRSLRRAQFRRHKTREGATFVFESTGDNADDGYVTNL